MQRSEVPEFWSCMIICLKKKHALDVNECCQNNESLKKLYDSKVHFLVKVNKSRGKKKLWGSTI